MQVVDYENDSPENIYVLNKTAYDDLMKGRTLVQDTSGSANDDTVYTDGDFTLNQQVEVLSPTSVKVSFSHTLYAQGVDPFEFTLRDKTASQDMTLSDLKISDTDNRSVILSTSTPLVPGHEYRVTVMFVSDISGNIILNGVNGQVNFNLPDTTSPAVNQPTLVANGNAAAEQFASLITAQETFYSFYSEQGNLGYTKVITADDPDKFEPYVYNYTTQQIVSDSAHVADGELSVNTDNSVNLLVDGTQDGKILCDTVLDLNGASVSSVLARITDPSELPVMQSTFAAATFSEGAKAYNTVHSYDDGSTDNELVLNEQAYQDLLKVMLPR